MEGNKVLGEQNESKQISSDDFVQESSDSAKENVTPSAEDLTMEEDKETNNNNPTGMVEPVLPISGQELEVSLKIVCPLTKAVYLESSIKTDYDKIQAFFQQHDMTIAPVSIGCWTVKPSSSGEMRGQTRKTGVKRKTSVQRRSTKQSPPAGSSKKQKVQESSRSRKFKGVNIKPLSRWEEELYDEPVDESQLMKSATSWSRILPGEIVYVRWTDGVFYSAVINNKLLVDSWNITFEDGNDFVASPSHIVPIKMLGVGIKGTYNRNDLYEDDRDGKIVEVIGQKLASEDGIQVVKYAVKIEDEELPMWCSRRQISIEQKDGYALKTQHMSTEQIPVADVQLYNIVETPRLRRTTSGAKTVDRSTRKIFSGMEFFLTAARQGDPRLNGNGAVTEWTAKADIEKNIKKYGGKIISDLGQESAKNVFLISNRYSRTMKYIYCVAAKIPTISEDWIKTCIEDKAIIDYGPFQLHAGWSLEYQYLVDAHQLKPLKGWKVVIRFLTETWKEYWVPVLRAAEAEMIFLDSSERKIPLGAHVIVAENTTGEDESFQELLKEAKDRAINVVKPEWIVQTIITGERSYGFMQDSNKIFIQKVQ